jgi:hypothetical protein
MQVAEVVGEAEQQPSAVQQALAVAVQAAQALHLLERQIVAVAVAVVVLMMLVLALTVPLVAQDT